MNDDNFENLNEHGSWYSCEPPARPASVRIAAGVTILGIVGAGVGFAAACEELGKAGQLLACAPDAHWGPGRDQLHIENVHVSSTANTVLYGTVTVALNGPTGSTGPST